MCLCASGCGGGARGTPLTTSGRCRCSLLPLQFSCPFAPRAHFRLLIRSGNFIVFPEVKPNNPGHSPLFGGLNSWPRRRLSSTLRTHIHTFARTHSRPHLDVGLLRVQKLASFSGLCHNALAVFFFWLCFSVSALWGFNLRVGRCELSFELSRAGHALPAKHEHDLQLPLLCWKEAESGTQPGDLSGGVPALCPHAPHARDPPAGLSD